MLLRPQFNRYCEVVGRASALVAFGTMARRLFWRQLPLTFCANRLEPSAHPSLMSALLPKADMCSATRYVRFVPIADIPPIHSINSSARCWSASRETNQKLKEALEKQAKAYRKLADKRAKELGLTPLEPPPFSGLRLSGAISREQTMRDFKARSTRPSN